MTYAQVWKQMQITNTEAMHLSTYKFAVECTENTNARKQEAEQLAKIMTGQETWQGVVSEKIHYSGLAKIANNYLKTTPTTLRIKEIKVYGDGTSKYITY